MQNAPFIGQTSGGGQPPWQSGRAHSYSVAVVCRQNVYGYGHGGSPSPQMRG